MLGQRTNYTGGEPYPPIMDQIQASRYLNMSTKTIFNLRRSRKLAYIKFGRAVRFHRSDLEEYAKRNRIPPEEGT